MAENVKVIVRCRPMNRKETESNCKCVVKTNNCVVEIWDPGEGPSFPKTFTFDSTYDQSSTTEAIYNDICYPLVESVLEGYNATIFVYGQTGCGKSFTMEGVKGGDPAHRGVISRTFDHVFEAISVTTGVKYLALVSYLEIYNEQIRDLLVPNDKMATSSTLSLKETPNEGVTVPGLTQHPVHNVNECENFLNVGSKNRMIGATLMNQNSSRSHSIFTISIEQISNLNNNESIRKGKLNLVDLAGSERQTKTGATGDRLKEATKINLSLSALGNVISALVDGKAKHIPYRDSKLTRLLQDSLGGNTRTLMIACISPSDRDYMETLSTLRYANRAKNIHNKPKVNEDPKDAILRQYQEEIERLKALLENQQPTEAVALSESIEINDNVDFDAKRDHLVQQYQLEMEKLKNLHESEKNEKETILKQIQTIKEEYEANIRQLNEEIRENRKKDASSKEEIVKRIEVLKAALIGGEKADDKELSERRKKKKLAAQKRASLIAHLLAKIEMNEDREILQNQYKDISQELLIKTEALRRYRHRVKALEKEVKDIHSEFEQEREDYLETIRRQDRSVKLSAQIAEKLAGTLKKECNYSDLEAIREQAIWLDDSQKYKLPDVVVAKTKLPPAGRFFDIQTAPARLNSEPSVDREDRADKKFEEPSKPQDLISSYFQPTTKRANELLSQSSKLESKAFNLWRGYVGIPEFAKRSRTRSTENLSQESPLNGGRSSQWLPSSPFNTDLSVRRPVRLQALPSIDKTNKIARVNTMDYL
ncbi:osmotic avoidance abnormal protein 3 isoform X8 [Cylas formicarius]|uniref:osmotic avoidance abnormal protein 3 isoform X8 n=1 Tax=Cylas formicarius TaxID=197179 RepID=UPI0029588E6E|nr:osmotic avoidance abnormal protein 3 isoform X8 [Cylas formicarius]XP_060534020.1 osmotic avoidance abnormal protein 3 isoform X8 [Cylas formicarius]XP_060534021.1 osmotic avoidance abnormal protein 3 isoform X8 [Cylas formicarius]